MKISRRHALKLGGYGLTATALKVMLGTGWAPRRLAHATPSTLPQIQFDFGDYIAPAETINGVDFRFGPVFTSFVTAHLTRTPTLEDQSVLTEALQTIEDRYAFSPAGLFTVVSYGIPYFRRLRRDIVREYVPRLRSRRNRFALEEAIPSPTDVSPRNPRVTKRVFNVPVAIERDDMLMTLRSDSMNHLVDTIDWLSGADSLNGKPTAAPAFNGLLRFTSNRTMFAQRGMPRALAEEHALPFAKRISPDSPMWMGFADQHVTGAGPASIVTFGGNDEARFTDATPGDYFYRGSIQHLSHVILDLEEWYDESYSERVQYMFRSNPVPVANHEEIAEDAIGPAFIEAKFQGRGDALQNAMGIGTPTASTAWAT